MRLNSANFAPHPDTSEHSEWRVQIPSGEVFSELFRRVLSCLRGRI